MKVSILIPVYNSERYVKQTIESALGQSWEDKEIIIVDDGSTDDSLAIAKSFEGKGVMVFTQTNAGACRARNRAFDESTGEYIQYLDADDILSNEKIQYQMELMAQGSRDVVFSCPWVRFYNDDEIEKVRYQQQFLDKNWDNPIDWLINSWKGKGMAQTSVWLTPRHLIENAGGWDERLSVNQDGEFFSRVLLEASAIKFTDKSVVYYRSGNENSVSQKRDQKKVNDLLLSYKLYEENILKKQNTERIRNAFATNYLSFIYVYHKCYPELVKEAWSYLRALRLKKLPHVGGTSFKFISSIIGFENSLKLKSLF